MYHTGLSPEVLVEALSIIVISLPSVYVFHRLLKKALTKWFPRYLEDHT